MTKPLKPVLWFNSKVRTKDDLQCLVVILLIAFVIVAKCYAAMEQVADNKQLVDTSLPIFTQPFLHTHFIFLK